MNRRQMLTNAVSGIGALAAVGINASTAPGCDNERDKGGKIKAAGDVCPIYPSMFFGSYTMYYGMITDGAGHCANPRSLNGPNSLPLGCDGGGCAAAKDKDGKEYLKSGHEQAKRHGCGRRPPSAHIDADGIDRIESDEIRMRCNDPANPRGPKIQVNVRLYRVTVTPRSFDTTFLSSESAALLGAIVGQQRIFFGHEIPTNPRHTGAFGPHPAEGDVVSDPESHVFAVRMRDEGEPFEVIIAKRT